MAFSMRFNAQYIQEVSNTRTTTSRSRVRNVERLDMGILNQQISLASFHDDVGLDASQSIF